MTKLFNKMRCSFCIQTYLFSNKINCILVRALKFYCYALLNQYVLSASTSEFVFTVLEQAKAGRMQLGTALCCSLQFIDRRELKV